MTSVSVFPNQARPAASCGETKFSLGPLVLAGFLALGFDLAMAMLAHNRMVMATWFVWTEVLLPLGLCFWGWLCYRVVTRRSNLTIVRMLRLEAIFLGCALAILPIPLAALNHLPIGQTTHRWEGRVIAEERLFFGDMVGSAIQVTSEETGRNLQFFLPGTQFNYLLSAKQTLRGKVVRGFMGMPIEVRLSTLEELEVPS